MSAFVRDRVTWLGYLAFTYLLYLESSLGPAMPSIRKDLGISYTVASLHFTVLATGAVSVAWAGDKLARRFGRGRSFWIGSLGVSIGSLMIALSPSVIGTIAGTSILGMSGALLSLVVQASLADRHADQRATAMSELNVAATSGMVFAAIAVGLAERTGLGWRGAILGGIALGSVAAFFLRGAEFTHGVPHAAGRRPPKNPLPRLFWLCVVVSTLSTAAEWGFAYWGSDFLDREVGFSRSGAAIAMAFFFVAIALGRIVGGRLARTLDGFDMMLGAFIIAVVGFPIFWLSGNRFVAIAGLMLVGVGISNVYPLIVSIATGLVPGQADVAIARLMFAGSCAVLAAPFALGVLGDLFGIKNAFGVIVPVLLTALVLVIRMRGVHHSSGTAVA